MNKGIKEICEILRTPDYPQIQGELVQLDHEQPNDRIVIGKCALGELSCRLGNSLTETIDISNWSTSAVYAKTILQLADGLPSWIVTGNWLPQIRRVHDVDETASPNILFDDRMIECNLGELIMNMNDLCFTYEEIADFLETTFEDLEEVEDQFRLSSDIGGGRTE